MKGDQVRALPSGLKAVADHRDLPPMTAEQRRELEEMERQMRALGYAGGDEEEDDVGARERRRIVEPVTDHHHVPAACAKLLEMRDLVGRALVGEECRTGAVYVYNEQVFHPHWPSFLRKVFFNL